MKRYVIHKVGIGSLGKLVGTWFSVVGFFVGVVAAVVTTVSIFENNDYGILAGVGVAALTAIGWVFVYPFLMYLLGWLQGAIVALVFNFVIAGSGGLSVHMEETNMDGTAKK